MKQTHMQEKEEKKMGVMGILKDFLPYALIGIILASGFRFAFAPSIVVGESMEGTMHDGDYLMVYKLAYSDKRIPEYGDVVILNSNEINGDELFIKRVVGKPGDTLEIKDGELYRDGDKVDEPYANEKMYDEDTEIKVPDGEVFVMGDNRNHSMDSRMIGSLDIEDEVIGKVITRLMPFDQGYKVK